MKETGKTGKKPRVALLWPGDRSTQGPATLEGTRFQSLEQALQNVGLEAVPAVYNDDFVDEVRDQLSDVDGVLVWVNPIEHGRDRSVLDAMLQQVASEGVFVSAHPTIIRKMGTKEVLVSTREMSWGCDVHLYTTIGQLVEQLPSRLNQGKPRVLKQYRGNGGNGVWKVERHPGDAGYVRVRHALRGSAEQDIPLSEFLAQCEVYFKGDGRIIDQAYQERLTDGMIRCYLVQDRVVGFGHQAINALFPAPLGSSPDTAPAPGPRLYHPPTKPEFRDILLKMKDEWLDALCDTLEIDTRMLPMIWDADFMYGPKSITDEDTYVLCEINVSSVYPFPDSALEPLAQAMKERLLG
ncbi:MAG: Cj0069 family protein [Chloroflexi bacterium]|nr:Cj0069 family protein [Chloroflexota bacterium]